MSVEPEVELDMTENPPVENEQRVWKSCCILTDKDAVVYISTFSLIAGIAIFCCYQLTNLKGCSDQQAYLSVLGMILGTLLPSPIMNNSKK